MNLKIMITTLIALMLFANVSLAIPGIPNAFYGSVTWNGQPAPDGITVIAKVNGVEVASTTTVGGKYGYPPGCKSPGYPNSFCVDDPNSDRVGKIINFFVNNVDTGQTAVFSGAQDSFVLNLVATGSTSTSSPSSSGSGGGGGGSIGGTNGGTTSGAQNQTVIAQQNQTCHEKWVCGNWGTCQNGIQTRTCNDESKCGTNNNEPFMSQPCSKEEIAKTEQTQTPLALPTGFFLGFSALEWITGIVIGIIVALVIIFLIMRNKRK